MATILLGGNRFTNCKATIEIAGLEVFRLRRRSGDGHVVADFEVRDTGGGLLARVAQNKVVFGSPPYTIISTKTHSTLMDTASRKVIAKAEEAASDTVKVTGTFHANGVSIVATDDYLQVGPLRLEECIFEGCGAGVVIGPRGPIRQ